MLVGLSVSIKQFAIVDLGSRVIQSNEQPTIYEHELK